MKTPLEITMRGLERSDSIDSRVRAKVEDLGHVYDRIERCHVTIEAPHHHQHQGNIYVVRVDIRVPDGAIVVNRQGRNDPAHEDVYVAIRDAFDAATRQLQDHARRRRGDVKRHGEEGRVIVAPPEPTDTSET